MASQLSKFFNPNGVALIGASSNPKKLSYGILANMIQYGYRGNIYPVNPGNEEILNLKCYPDISKVPDPVELAVIILPAPQIPDIINACGIRGIKTVIVISGGFKELSTEGAELEASVLKIVKHYNMRLIGPNCVGTVDLFSGLNTTFIKGLPERGSIGFISQSGAVCGGVVDYIMEKGIGFSHFISLGNEADITETDMMEYLSEDPNTQVIAIYAESIKDGRRFIDVAKKVTSHKPVVMLKAGRSEAGARAVSSHTGSMAGSQSAYEAAFQQSGVLVAESIQDLIDIAHGLATQPLPKGNHVVIITNAGGPAALASDSLSANSMCMNDLMSETKDNLRKKLVAAAQVGNPVDMLGGADASEYEMALSTILNDNKVDAAIVILVPQSLVNPANVADAIVKSKTTSQKPVIAVMMGDASISDARKILEKNNIPLFIFPESAGRTLGMMYRYYQWKNSPQDVQPQIDHINNDLSQKILAKLTHIHHLGEAATRPLLKSYGITTIAGEVATSVDDAKSIARKIGYPVVLKIVSPEIIHKSDSGGIRLGMTDDKSVSIAFDEMITHIHKIKPEANIEGILVEAMAPKGYEVIVGMKRDPSFGPLMMFGMGGVFVEIITDVAFCIAPLTIREAKNMIYQTKAGRMLSGLRGQEPSDIDAIVDTILRLSLFAMNNPNIEEIEINPLLVLSRGNGVIALDARIILSETLN